MRVVSVGGNDCMVRNYRNLRAEYRCCAKVFTQMKDGLKDKIGSPDLMILFMTNMSQKMIQAVLRGIKGHGPGIARSHSSFLSASHRIPENHVS